MRIAFDAYWHAEGPISNRAVQRAIISSWAEEFPDDRIALLLGPDDSKIACPTLPRPEDTYATLRLKPHGAAILVEAGTRKLVRQSDAVISHNFSIQHRRSYVFIHDMLFETNPEWFGRAERTYFKGITWSSRRANIIFTSSNAERDRIANVTGRPLTEVVATGLGLDAALLDSNPVPPTGMTNQPRYILCVGRLNRRKNLSTLLSAMAYVWESDPEIKLVVVGEQQGASVERPYDARVTWLSSVSSAQLRWLYENCSTFVFPSLGEGYGLPAAEALQFSSRIAVSDIPVFREVVGDHGHYFNPHSAESMGCVLAELSKSPEATTMRRPGVKKWSAVVHNIRAAITEDSGAN